VTTLVSYRTDGFWILIWLRFSLRWIGLLPRKLPGPGFVGQVSGSIAAFGHRRIRPRWTRLRRIASTHDAPQWQLTCGWVATPHRVLRLPFGLCLVVGGNYTADVGEETSERARVRKYLALMKGR